MHRDQTQWHVDAFNAQLPALVKAYMEWMLQLGKDGYSGKYMLPLGAEVQGTMNIREVDVYCESSIMFLSFFCWHFLQSQETEMLLFIIYQQMNTFVVH